MKSVQSNVLRFLLAMAALLGHALVQAQAWPTKPVRLVAAFPPGTPGDLIARLIQPVLQAAWNQPVVVENKPGAGGNLAAIDVAQAKDNHTLLVGPDTILTINPHLYRKLQVDLRRDLLPVTYFASFNQTLVCNPGTGIASVDAFAKAASNRVYASGGPGTPSHMTMELLLSTLGTKMTHVPYKGPGPAAQDVVAGHVDCGFVVSSVVIQQVQAGKLNAVAVSSKQRSVILKDVPTIAESGHPSFDATFFETLMAPSNMPKELVSKIHKDVHAALSNPTVVSRLSALDLRVEGNAPEEARQRSSVDSAKWAAIAQRAGIALD